MIPQPYALPRAVFPYTKTVGVKSVIDDLRETAFGVEYGSNGDVISVDEWEPGSCRRRSSSTARTSST